MFSFINKLSTRIKKHFSKTIDKSIADSIDLQKILQESAEITQISLEENLKRFE